MQMPPAAPSPMMGTPPGGVSGAPAGAFPGDGAGGGVHFVPHHKGMKGRKHLSRKGKKRGGRRKR